MRSMCQPVIRPSVIGLPVWSWRLQDVGAGLNSRRKHVGLGHGMTEGAVVVVAGIRDHLAAFLRQELLRGTHARKESPVTSHGQDPVPGKGVPQLFALLNRDP